MRVPPAEYLNLELRAHELLRDVPLYDVSAVDLPGGGEGRSLSDIRALDRTARPTPTASVLYSARRFLGRLFGWDRTPLRPEDSLVPRLSERDRLESEIPPGTGYRLYWAVYALPVSWMTRPYLMLIEPFRRVLYPAMLGRIRRAWIGAYGPR
jgi:hypothetical protein